MRDLHATMLHLLGLDHEELTFKPKMGPNTFSKKNLKRQGG